jgi:proteasome accessory factor C
VSPGLEKGRTEAHGRLRRLLFLVPYVVRNPGQPVDEVARAMGTSRDELLSDLDLLTLVGRPPFQPDDYIDIYVENDRVFVDLDQRLKAPPRLTAAEGVALAAAAKLLRPAAGEALASALAKLERILPAHAVGPFRDMHRQLDVALEAPSGLPLITEAIVGHREIEFDYYTAHRGESQRRRAQPWVLLSHRGTWYLSAKCLARAEERLFRLDRITNLSLTEERFEPPASILPKGMPSADDTGELVHVRFAPAAAPYVRERFGSEARDVGAGEVEVRVPGDSERWLTQWILSFGGEARVLRPAWAVEAVARAARARL